MALALPEVLVEYEGAGNEWYLHLPTNIATDDGTAWTYSAADGLGSVRQELDASGGVAGANSFRPFGTPLAGNGGDPYGYTGAWWDAYIKLLALRARRYDPDLARFVSPDPIAPEFSFPPSIHRYAYVSNNPINYTDPSGHDPLGPEWEEEFRRVNGREPTDRDRRDRLFSLLFPGRGPNGSWTEDDWIRYSARDVYVDGLYVGNLFWVGGATWDPDDPPSVHRFAKHVELLAACYSEGEEDLFVRAFAWVFGGIPYDGSIHLAALSVAPGPKVWMPLQEGEAGWDPLWVEPGDNPSHHYAGLLFAGYHYGPFAHPMGFIRDYDNPPDLMLGEIGILHGMMLRQGYINPWLLPANMLYMLSVEHPH